MAAVAWIVMSQRKMGGKKIGAIIGSYKKDEQNGAETEPDIE